MYTCIYVYVYIYIYTYLYCQNSHLSQPGAMQKPTGRFRDALRLIIIIIIIMIIIITMFIIIIVIFIIVTMITIIGRIATSNKLTTETSVMFNNFIVFFVMFPCLKFNQLFYRR